MYCRDVAVVTEAVSVLQGCCCGDCGEYIAGMLLW